VHGATKTSKASKEDAKLETKHENQQASVGFRL